MCLREFDRNKVMDSLKNYMDTRRRTIDDSKKKDKLDHNNSYHNQIINKTDQSLILGQEDKLGLFTDPTSN